MMKRRKLRDITDKNERETIDFLVEGIIDHFFYTGVSGKELQESDKVEIGSYLPYLINKILINLQFTHTNFRLTSRVFCKRSVIEFLMDEFGDIEVDGKSLKNILSEKDLGMKISREIDEEIEGLRILAESRKNKVNSESQSLEFSDGSDDSDLDEWELVPKEHQKWWHPETASKK